jgi:Glycosyl hydrolase family 81 C-terminal domain
MSNLTANSSGDQAGNYYTGTAEDLGSVSVPAGINGGASYICPGSPSNANPNFGPFTGSGFSATNLGPVGSHKVWTPFAAWNQQQTVLPLPLTIQANANGFQFSNPPVFNSGNDYIAALPNDNTQPPAQYYGNSQADFIVAPSTSGTQQPSAPFPLPTDPANDSTPFTQLEGFSDWAATVSLANATESMQLTFANGSPLAFLGFDTEFAWFQPSAPAPLAFLSPFNLPQVVLPPGTSGCPGTSPCTIFGGGPPTYAVGESYPITWISLGVGSSVLLDLYFITPNGQTLVASGIANNGLYNWTPQSSQVTGQSAFTGSFWLVQTGQVPPAITGANAQSINFAVVASTSELPSNQPSLTAAAQPPANALFGSQYLNDAQIPLASWFPQGYSAQTPPSVQILVGGPTDISIFNELSITFDGQTARYTTVQGDTNETAAQNLQLACQQTFTTLNVGAVQASGQSHLFLLSNQSGEPLTTASVTASPNAGSPTVQTVVGASNQPASINNPPAEIVGLTITGVASATSASGSYYQSSYLLIAPSGSQWTFQNGGAELVCQFPAATPPATQGGTIIIVGMPQVSAEAYANYNTPQTGAAVILQSFWTIMSPYAYGCPRHLDSNGQDDGTGTQFGPNDGRQFTPQVTTADGKTSVTTNFSVNLTYPLGQPGGAQGTLFGLFPHQWRAYAGNTATLLTAGENALSYQTVMGMLKLCGGEKFSTTYAVPGLLSALPNVAGLNGEESFNVYDYPSQTAQTVNSMTLSEQLAQDATAPVWSANNFGATAPGVGGSQSAQNAFIPAPPSFQQNWGLDSYDWGKIVGGLGDLIQPCFLLGNSAAGQAAISQLNAQLGQWLSGALIYADDATPFPPGVEPWQTSQGDKTFSGSTGLNSGQQFLYYDSQWATFIPYPTAYYADTNINDHHFHYGYWLRAAAQLALAQASGQDPDNVAGTFISNYGATINLIVKDIANPLRGDQGTVGASAISFPNGPATPFLRYFDGYFGHSWASGLPYNILNQESLSEAMSAWTGVIMWGELTGDTRMRDLGIWMYTHEMFSFYEYWMDCAQMAADGSTLFPSGSAANIVGDAYAQSVNSGTATATLGFCTQVYNSYLELTSDFGMDPLYLTGIEWLPFHGGSLYLSSTDAAVNATLKAVFNWARSNSLTQWQPTNNGTTLPFYQPTPFAVTWEPVAWNHAATIGIDAADNLWASLEQAVGSSGTTTAGDGWKPLGGQSVSYSYYWIQNINTLGLRDATVTADYPFAVKFINGATSTSYVVNNLTNAPLTVTFSDGKVVSKVAPYSLKVVPGDIG